MENLRKLFTRILLVSFGALTLVSCLKENSVPLQGTADVWIQDMKTDAGVKYGIVIYTSINYDILSAKATAPGSGGKVYELTPTSNKQQFVYYPQPGEFTSELPVKGDYLIEVTAVNGESVSGKDALGDEKLNPIVIKTATMANQKLKITWDKIANADAYVVKLYSENKAELLYSSDYLASDLSEYEFGAYTPAWFSDKLPMANTNYVVELLGIRPETGVTVDKGNNIQFITVDSKTIKWE